MKVVITPEAESNLDEIGRYIAADNPARAVTFVAEIIDACEQLVDVPRAFPLVPRYEGRGVRRRLHGRYLIFYRIDGKLST